ncbi:MAG: DUF4097 family beta strand repeat-containing protein [Anaerolineales bacterium]
MAEQNFPREDLVSLEFSSIGGDLHLSGWSRDEIRINDADGDAKTQKKKTTFQVSSPGDLFIHIPHSLAVSIKNVSGDAHIKGIGGDLDLDSVAGDLNLREVRSARIKTCAGNLTASRVQGDLRGDSISGDCLVDDVQGQVELKDVAGDLQIQKIDGGIDAKAAGDGMVDFHPVPWQAYRIKVSGDLAVIMPADIDADLSISSGEEDIRIFPGKLNIHSKVKEFEHKLGEGGTAIHLSAAGSVFISDNEFDLLAGFKVNLEEFGRLTADFSLESAEQIKASMGNLEEELRESLSGLAESLEDIGLSEESLRDLGVQIEETSRKAAEKAQIAAIKAQAGAEKEIAKARKKAIKAREKAKQFDINEFLASKSSRGSVTEKERMLILQMLQEKKISAEEADKLLKALEGK